jgi:ABC-type polysaccharide/polyol phosphate export permease
MQNVSNYNPISYAVDAVRDLSLPGYFSWSAEVYALVYIALIALVTMGATLYLFRRVIT